MQTRLRRLLPGLLLITMILGACDYLAPEATMASRYAALSGDAATGLCGKLANSKGCCFPDGNNGYCDKGQVILKSCGTQKCGWNGGKYACGPSAGSDPGGIWARSCLNYLPPPPEAGGGPFEGGPQPVDGGPTPPTDTPPPFNPCTSLPAEGCCMLDGKRGHCVGGNMLLETCKSGLQCGWNNNKYQCGASAGADPSGKHPRSCSAYLPPPPDQGGPPKLDKGPPQLDKSPPTPDMPPPTPDMPPPAPDMPPPPPDMPPPPPDMPPPAPDMPPPPPDMKPPTPDKKPPTPDKKPPAPDKKVPGPDAKQGDDAKVTPDKKVPTPDKKVATPDKTPTGEAGADQKVGGDASTKADAGGGGDEEDTGCSCSTSTGSPGGLLALFGLLLLGLRRRRR